LMLHHYAHAVAAAVWCLHAQMTAGDFD